MCSEFGRACQAVVVAAVLASALLAACVLPGCTGRTLEAYPGELAGVGVVLQSSAEGFVLGRLVSGGPADAAGLHPGDRLVAIDGEPVAGRTLAAVVERLRGSAGSVVALRVAGSAGEATVLLTRRPLAKGAGGYEAK